MLIINPSAEKFGGFLSRYMQVGTPRAIGYLYAYLKKHGIKVRIHDEEIEEITPSSLRNLVEGLDRPYIFGLSTLTAHAVRAYQLIEMFKTVYPDCTVIVGGYHATALPEEPLQYGADFVVRGEGEEVMLKLHRAIRSDQNYAGIAGINHKQDGRFIHNPEATLIENLGTIPRFPFELFEHPKYDKGFILSSRGCPYRCNYCSIRMMNGSAYRFFPVSRILEELDILINKYHQTQIMFTDDNFCFKKSRVIELCNAMVAAGFPQKASFSIQTRADNFYADVVPAMATAGFRHAGFGMETGVDRLAQIVSKGETVQQHRQAVALAKKHGMSTSLFMIFGLPTETDADRQETYRVVQSMSVQVSKYNNLIPYPGTPIYEFVKNSPRIYAREGWANFNSTLSVTRSIFDRTPLAYVPETMSEFELKRDIIRYNLKTYFQFRTIKEILLGAKGPGWVQLPKRWYLKPVEIYHLLKTTLVLLTNLLIANLPLAITEPMMNALNPTMKKRMRVPNAAEKVTIAGWSVETARRFQGLGVAKPAGAAGTLPIPAVLSTR